MLDWLAVTSLDKQAWLRTNLPTVASLTDEFSLAFGRENFKVVYANENGHVLGKRVELDGVKLSETLVGSMALKARE